MAQEMLTDPSTRKPLATGKAHLSITLTTSTSKISLSSPDTTKPLNLNLTTRIISSTFPSSAITFSTNNSVLDNGQHVRHDGIFRGAFRPLLSTTNPDRKIGLAFIGTPNYGSLTDPKFNDMRERPWTRFETVPPLGEGELVIKHELSLERLFRYSHSLKIEDVQPGEKFRIQMNPKKLVFAEWWNFGDIQGELQGKKFARWKLLDEDGDIFNLMPGDPRPDFEKMSLEGWVFSQRLDDLEATQDADHDVVIGFIE
ncbi:MAG: hypothetical protein Q9164_003241 [Protoblastenia rupestris]